MSDVQEKMKAFEAAVAERQAFKASGARKGDFRTEFNVAKARRELLAAVAKANQE